jgi:transcriptional regulator with XRE-family HTH domain
MTTVGQRIRDARKAKKLTLVQLAKMTDDVAHNISRYERSRTTIPRSKVARIALALGMDVGELELGISASPTPPRTPDDPVLAAFLATPEGQSVTPDELHDLCGMHHGEGEPTQLAYHFALMYLRALRR